MGNYKSVVQCQSDTPGAAGSTNSPAVIIADLETKLAQSGKLTSMKKMSLVKHLRNLSHNISKQGAASRAACCGGGDSAPPRMVYPDNLEIDGERLESIKEIDEESLPRITLRHAVEPDYITIGDMAAVKNSIENFYESTSEIMHQRQLLIGNSANKSDNYFSIYDAAVYQRDECDTPQGLRIQNLKETTETMVLFKSNSTNDLYSEVNLGDKAGKKSTCTGVGNLKSVTLSAKTGMNISRLIANKKGNLYSISKLIQKLTKNGSKTSAAAVFNLPPKSFDPRQELYATVSHDKTDSRHAPEPPTALPPPRPLSAVYESVNKTNDINNNNNSKEEQVMCEDNYQSMPEYDYIPQTMQRTPEPVSSPSSSSPQTPPRPPPASTQPSLLNATSQQLFTSIEPFNINNQIYYSFTSPSGTTFETDNFSLSNTPSLASSSSISNNQHSSNATNPTSSGASMQKETNSIKKPSVITSTEQSVVSQTQERLAYSTYPSRPSSFGSYNSTSMLIDEATATTLALKQNNESSEQLKF